VNGVLFFSLVNLTNLKGSGRCGQIRQATMSKYKQGFNRDELLAAVSHMYYEANLTQAEISREIGMTRSSISRLLTEARQKGIVEIAINLHLHFDKKLEKALIKRFNLRDANVLLWEQSADNYDQLRERLGRVAARTLSQLLNPHMVLGVAWGTTVYATIEALKVPAPIPMDVVQLVGVLGSSSHAFNAQALVSALAYKVGGKGTYLYSPFILENGETARSILSNKHVSEAIALGRECDVALLGIGSTNAEYCSLCHGGHISRGTLLNLVKSGAVGDVTARYFDQYGGIVLSDFHDRLVGIAREDLLAIPTRLGVAGDVAKAPAILGALRGGYVNMLVTDSATAEAVLQLEN
jgi:deoxyribonucleoside regulator